MRIDNDHPWTHRNAERGQAAEDAAHGVAVGIEEAQIRTYAGRSCTRP
jgi:hypothetical protein